VLNGSFCRKGLVGSGHAYLERFILAVARHDAAKRCDLLRAGCLGVPYRGSQSRAGRDCVARRNLLLSKAFKFEAAGNAAVRLDDIWVGSSEENPLRLAQGNLSFQGINAVLATGENRVVEHPRPSGP